MKKSATWIRPFNFSDKYRSELINLFKKWTKNDDGADEFIKSLEHGIDTANTFSEIGKNAPSRNDYKSAIKDLSGALTTLSDLAKNTDRNILNFVRDEFLLQYKHVPLILNLLSSDKWIDEIIGLKICCDRALAGITGTSGRIPYLSELHLVASVSATFRQFGIKGEISENAKSRIAQVLKLILQSLEYKGIEGDDDQAITIVRSIIRRYKSQAK